MSYSVPFGAEERAAAARAQPRAGSVLHGRLLLTPARRADASRSGARSSAEHIGSATKRAREDAPRDESAELEAKLNARCDRCSIDYEPPRADESCDETHKRWHRVNLQCACAEATARAHAADCGLTTPTLLIL